MALYGKPVRLIFRDMVAELASHPGRVCSKGDALA